MLIFVVVLLVSVTAQSIEPFVQNVTKKNKSDALPLVQGNPIPNVKEEVTRSYGEEAAKGHTESFINRTVNQLEVVNAPEHSATSDSSGPKEKSASTKLSQPPSLKLNNTVNGVCIQVIQRESVCDLNLVTQFIVLF